MLSAVALTACGWQGGEVAVKQAKKGNLDTDLDAYFAAEAPAADGEQPSSCVGTDM